MLAFVHKLPCRDDDGVTTKDLSKVRTFFVVSSSVGWWLSVSHSLFFHLHHLATPFERTDGEFRDVSAAAVPWRASQFLSSSEEKEIYISWASSTINCTVMLFIQGIVSLRVWLFRKKAPPHFTWQQRRAKFYRPSCSWCTVQTLVHPTSMDAPPWTTPGMSAVQASKFCGARVWRVDIDDPRFDFMLTSTQNNKSKELKPALQPRRCTLISPVYHFHCWLPSHSSQKRKESEELCWN